MSQRGSKNAVFLDKCRDTQFKKGPDLVSKTDLDQFEKLFKKWKSKPWSVNREKVLGELSQKIRKAKHHLEGISKHSTLQRFGGKN